VSHDWILGSKSIFLSREYAAVRERGTLTRSKVACPVRILSGPTVHVHVHVKHAFYFESYSKIKH
jgi:hypothetical protein